MKRQWLDRRIAAPGPYLALCLTLKDLRAAFADLGQSPPDTLTSTAHSHATTWVVEAKGGWLACIVAMQDWEGRDPVEVAGLLVHEAVHVWQQYADRIGEREPGREQEAYAIQSIAQELMAEFARQVA